MNWYHRIIVYPPLYNSLMTATGTISYEATGSDRSLQRLVEGEIDFAVLVTDVMSQDNLSSALALNKVMLLPLFMRRVVPLYSFPSPFATTDDLVISADVMSMIWVTYHGLISSSASCLI
jgi:hypothetical protein